MVKNYSVTSHSKTSASMMSKLYLFLLFLRVDQEFHQVLDYLSHPLVQDFLAILEDLENLSAALFPYVLVSSSLTPFFVQLTNELGKKILGTHKPT